MVEAAPRVQNYVALLGEMVPSTGEPNQHPGFAVARLDLQTLKVEPFFKARPEALGPKGFEYVATAGPKRPVDVKFAPDGNSLYVVDFGAMTTVPTAVGPSPLPFPGTGVVWRITPVARPGCPPPPGSLCRSSAPKVCPGGHAASAAWTAH